MSGVILLRERREWLECLALIGYLAMTETLKMHVDSGENSGSLARALAKVAAAAAELRLSTRMLHKNFVMRWCDSTRQPPCYIHIVFFFFDYVNGIDSAGIGGDIFSFVFDDLCQRAFKHLRTQFTDTQTPAGRAGIALVHAGTPTSLATYLVSVWSGAKFFCANGRITHPLWPKRGVPQGDGSSGKALSHVLTPWHLIVPARWSDLRAWAYCDDRSIRSCEGEGSIPPHLPC